MAKRDYYEVLDVAKDSALDEIKKAYRKLAVKYHPDRNPGDKGAEEKFKEATEAYEVLRDEKRRKAYDQFGFAGVEGVGSGAHDYSTVFHEFEDIFGDFSGIFESFFGSGAGRSGRRRGETTSARGSDLRYNLEIAFKDAVFGTKVEIGYQRNFACSVCGGSGAESGSGKKMCPTCGGSGQVRRSSGFFSIASPCATCSGEGFIIEHPCRSCGGTGLSAKNQKIKVAIPPGMESGKRISIPEQGDSGPNGGPPGDLYVYVSVHPHKHFERQDNDLYCAIPISITQAALGADLLVATLDEKKIKLKIPPGTQNGKTMRIHAEGIPYLHNPNRRGDLFVKILVQIPAKLSPRARDLLKELATIQGEVESPDPISLSELR